MPTISDLLRALSGVDQASAEELARALRTSRPTVSRLLSQASDEVRASGVTRGRRYARARVLPEIGALPVHELSETGAVRPFGTLLPLVGGRHWLERTGRPTRPFVGLPPWASEMSPQGFLGQAFPSRHADLGLPPRIGDWNDDHRLIALARRGEDCIGNLIIGEESLNRFLASAVEEVPQDAFVELAQRALRGDVGSSAPGEHPKFLCFSAGRHVLVKIYGGDESDASRRWRDLAAAEVLALEHVAKAGLLASTARWLDDGSFRFVEVERFDRLGLRGRRALLSLGAIDDEYFGHRDTWSQAAKRMRAQDYVPEEDARRMAWLDVFGQLIANPDRHFGNISFFVEHGRFRLAPVYDMLPMLFAPAESVVVDRRFHAGPRPRTRSRCGTRRRAPRWRSGRTWRRARVSLRASAPWPPLAAARWSAPLRTPRPRQNEDYLAAARQVVSRRHANLHDPRGRQRLLTPRQNATVYHYAYLPEANTMCFWNRERVEVQRLLFGSTESQPGWVLSRGLQVLEWCRSVCRSGFEHLDQLSEPDEVPRIGGDQEPDAVDAHGRHHQRIVNGLSLTRHRVQQAHQLRKERPLFWNEPHGPAELDDVCPRGCEVKAEAIDGDGPGGHHHVLPDDLGAQNQFLPPFEELQGDTVTGTPDIGRVDEDIGVQEGRLNALLRHRCRPARSPPRSPPQRSSAEACGEAPACPPERWEGRLPVPGASAARPPGCGGWPPPGA
jgi:hypothetical protein